MRTSKQPITQELIDNKSMDYATYRELLINLYAEGKTTGDNHSEAMLNYAKLNLQRLKKWDKITKLSEEVLIELGEVIRDQEWIVLTEGWCGDAAQNLPIINKIAETSEKINLRLLLRDENLEVMDCYLTNGGRSIPKLIILDSEDKTELATWGPRPAPIHHVMVEMKEAGDFSYESFAEKAHTWYAKDKAQSLQEELTAVLSSINS